MPEADQPATVGAIGRQPQQTDQRGVLQAAAYELVPGFPAQLDGSGLDPVGTTMLTVPYLERTAAEGGANSRLDQAVAADRLRVTATRASRTTIPAEVSAMSTRMLPRTPSPGSSDPQPSSVVT